MGNAIRQSGIPREEFFITTKLWVQDYEYDDALRAFDRSMKKLGLDYLDLYLMHKPYGNYYAAWRAMERLYNEGQNGIFSHPLLKEIAARYGKSIGAVVLRWLNQRNIVVIPKTVRKERMAENFNILDFTLSDAEMAAIATLDTGKSPIYDDMDLPTVRSIGLHKIHE